MEAQTEIVFWRNPGNGARNSTCVAVDLGPRVFGATSWQPAALACGASATSSVCLRRRAGHVDSSLQYLESGVLRIKI